jgi:hypothetical protein
MSAHRLATLLGHLFPHEKPEHTNNVCLQHEKTAIPSLMFDSAELKKALYDSKAEYIREKIFELAAKEPELFLCKEEEYQSMQKQRDLAFKRLKRILEMNLVRIEDFNETPDKVYALLEAVSYIDASAAGKIGSTFYHFFLHVSSSCTLWFIHSLPRNQRTP